MVLNDLLNCLIINDTGNQDVRIVHHRNLNKRILVGLIACSALLAGIFVFVLYIFFRRHKNLTSSTGKSNGIIGMMSVFTCEILFLSYFFSESLIRV